MKKDNIIKYLIIVIVFLYLSIAYIYGSYFDINEYRTIVSYEEISDIFSSDPIIINVSDNCFHSINKVKCVFNEIPMNYDYDRVGSSEPKFRTPGEYALRGGVCRDYTVYRHSALKNLEVECIFNFNEPNHVYLICYYNDNVYELNNGYYSEVSNGKSN